MGQFRQTTAGLTAWQLVMLALGTVVGGSFFLGSAIILRATGPSILIALALGGALVFLILRALAELTVGRPAHGSFREYAEQALGPAAGFVVGWVYWTGMMLAMSSEATAVAIFLRLWVDAPLWLLSGLLIVAVTMVNLLTPHLFGRLETVMAGLKLGAVVLFILAAVTLVVGAVPGRSAVGSGALAGQPLAPGGVGGIAGSMLLVMFMYAGFEVMGLAATDARQPQRTVPRAVAYTALALVALYLTTFAVLLPLLPRDSGDSAQPAPRPGPRRLSPRRLPDAWVPLLDLDRHRTDGGHHGQYAPGAGAGSRAGGGVGSGGPVRPGLLADATRPDAVRWPRG